MDKEDGESALLQILRFNMAKIKQGNFNFRCIGIILH